MKKYIYSKQSSMFFEKEVIGFGEDDFFIKEINKKLSNKIIKKNHYSKKVYAGTYISLGIFIKKKLIGVLQYGYAMNPASASSVVEGTQKDEYLELNRMWLDDIAPRNSESRAISFSIKFIKKKYPKIKWIQSFADERCGGFGIVYQACSFDYFGEHTSTFWELDGVVYHNTLMTAKNGKQGRSGDYLQMHKDRAKSFDYRQFRYIFFIKKNLREKCNLKLQKYPKYYEEK